MLVSELKSILADLSLSQSDFARLVGVTSRAVSLWLRGDREIPGPVEAYLRLVASLPPGMRQTEFARIEGRTTPMREGMYGIFFQYGGNPADFGMGSLVLENGIVYGADVGGARYDGDYEYNERSKLVDVRLKVTFPPNGMSVFGIAHPHEWSIEVRTTFNPAQDISDIVINTNLGRQLKGRYQFLRPLPVAA